MTSQDIWMKNRIGYGHLDAPYWFIGMEEAGRPDELAIRTTAPYIQDLKKAHVGLWNGRYDKHFRARDPTLQRTWDKLIRLLLFASRGRADVKMIKHYQANRWGRFGGETLLTELYPVASPRLATADYQEALLPWRIRLLRNLLRTHRPRFVICYGTTYRDQFMRLFPEATQWRALSDRDPHAGHVCGNAAIVPHPTSPGQTNTRFELIGHWASQFAASTTPELAYV